MVSGHSTCPTWCCAEVSPPCLLPWPSSSPSDVERQSALKKPPNSSEDHRFGVVRRSLRKRSLRKRSFAQPESASSRPFLNPENATRVTQDGPGERGSGKKDELSLRLVAFADGESLPPLVKSERAGNRNGKPSFCSQIRKLFQNVVSYAHAGFF